MLKIPGAIFPQAFFTAKAWANNLDSANEMN